MSLRSRHHHHTNHDNDSSSDGPKITILNDYGGDINTNQRISFCPDDNNRNHENRGEKKCCGGYLFWICCAIVLLWDCMSLVSTNESNNQATTKTIITAGGEGEGAITSSSSIEERHDYKPFSFLRRKRIDMDDLRYKLRKISSDSSLNNESQECPQYMAIKWIVKNFPGLPTSVSIEETYIVLVLLYSSSGSHGLGPVSSLVNGSTSICDWHTDDQQKGFFCDEKNQSIAEIHLTNSDLHGTIPSEIQHLSSLTTFEMHNNEMKGTIPTELFAMPKLIRLLLNKNKFSGTIPSQVGNKTDLFFFSIGNNNLVGTIPTEIGYLTSIRYLFLQDNQLTGTIPTEIGNLDVLNMLNMRSNQLRGRLPTEFGRLQNALRYLYLNNNTFTGTIPTEFGNFNRKIFSSLFLNSNQLSGQIPTEIGHLMNMRELKLRGNQLEGNTLNRIYCNFTSIQMNYRNLITLQADSCLPDGTKLKCDCCCCHNHCA